MALIVVGRSNVVGFGLMVALVAVAVVTVTLVDASGSIEQLVVNYRFLALPCPALATSSIEF